MNVSLMITCLGDVLRPEVGKATVRLLRRLGVSVDFPNSQTCCGQPMFNSGYREMARQQAMHTISVFEKSEMVVVPSGSCAAMVKIEYPHLFAEDGWPDDGFPNITWHSRAIDLANRTYELSDFLVNKMQVSDVGAKFNGKVTYHYACHLRMLDLTDEVETLIQHVAGAQYIPLQRQDQCCGFGGSFAVRYSEISTAMVDDKTSCISATDADVVVSTDAGCLMNIGGRFRRLNQPIEVLHIAELLERQ